MIVRVTAEVNIPPFLIKRIDSFKPFTGGSWDRTDKEIKVFKKLVRSNLLKAQNNKCAYCGLPLDETGKTEIEHFAPKGGPVRPRHTEFTFEVDNLYLSCNLCNSPLKKGIKDTVIFKHPKYSNCTFNIVHPRFDEPDIHYSWVVNDAKVIIQSLTDKGLRSINMFKLDSSAHSEARARIEMHKRFNALQPADKDLIRTILGYK